MEDNVTILGLVTQLIEDGDAGDTWDDLRLLALAIKAMAEGSE